MLLGTLPALWTRLNVRVTVPVVVPRFELMEVRMTAMRGPRRVRSAARLDRGASRASRGVLLSARVRLTDNLFLVPQHGPTTAAYERYAYANPGTSVKNDNALMKGCPTIIDKLTDAVTTGGGFVGHVVVTHVVCVNSMMIATE